MLAWDIFLVMTPSYGAQLKLSASQIGIIMAAYSVAVFAMRFFTAPVTRAFTPWQILLLSLGVTATAMVCFGLVSSVPLLILCAVAMGAGQAFALPTAQAALFENTPNKRYSEAMGLRMAVGMTCQFVLPLLAGSAAAITGIEPLFWLVGTLLLAGAWVQRARWTRTRE